MITIDKLRFEDLQGLIKLYHDAFEVVSDYNKMLETLNQIENDSNHIILTAKTEGKVVGSVLGVICNVNTTKT